jgi:hypothetical protein
MNPRRRNVQQWLAETDFWWVIPTILALATVVLTVMDAVYPGTSHYHMWALGCVAAMLMIAVSRGSRL